MHACHAIMESDADRHVNGWMDEARSVPAVVSAPVAVAGAAAGVLVAGTDVAGLVGASVVVVLGPTVQVGAGVAADLHRHSVVLLHAVVLLAVFILRLYEKK